MSNHVADSQQQDLFGDDAARSLLDQLLEDSRLYRTSQDFQRLLTFVARLRNFAPFNAMLLEIQKPGLSYAASALDWRERFGRKPKESARPLLILWPFGPVALVYDVQDTEGKPLPEDAFSFVANGPMTAQKVLGFHQGLSKAGVDLCWIDSGDRHAGFIRVVWRASNPKELTRYQISINRNHSAAAQFATLTHELAHMTLGHLGADRKNGIPRRQQLSHAQQELEAESVSFILCERNGIKSRAHRYLSDFVGADTSTDSLDVYRILRAAGMVESLLGLGAHTRFDRPAKGAIASVER